jgi:maltooligosyltrehalose trehalohydrolase
MSTNPLRTTVPAADTDPPRRLAQGAELATRDGRQGTHFRVWAPNRSSVEILLEKSSGAGKAVHRLGREPDGHWSGFVPDAGAGARYRVRLDGDGGGFPDPASRSLPEGPHGPSEIVDPDAFAWTDSLWTGLPLHGQLIYELHVGTFSPEGTWQGAIAKLPLLQALGVTAVEVMPVAEFPGRFGWGYDGVAWFAPSHLYGTPDDFRRFVNEAHRLGLGVLLDVVYNHLGPDGNYLEQFSPRYLAEHTNEWGRGMNFDGEDCAPVRRYVTDNAAYWIEEFHLDGLRLDATQALTDGSGEHIIAALGRAARAAAGGRRLLLIGENEPQDANLIRSTELGGLGLDGLWNDDLHHSMNVALTGRRQAYYSDYAGTASEWLGAVKHGFLFQGQRSVWQGKRRGHPARGLPAASFVAFLENHDQVANSLGASRLWTQSNPACHRALTALLLLGPWTPMLFQGQEWGSTAPFHYFADHTAELARAVREGRATFMSQFPGCVTGSEPSLLPDPSSPALHEASRLRWDERELPAHAASLRLHTDLAALRRSDPTLGAHAATGVSIEVAALTATCGIIRYFVDGPVGSAGPQERLLLVNVGPDLVLPTIAEPLLSPPDRPQHARWRILWNSEDPRYGGQGCAEPDSEEKGWRIPGAATVLLGPVALV